MNIDVPVIILKNLIILPNQEIKIELNNLTSRKAINVATSDYKGEILVIAPTDLLEEEPSVTDLPKVGVIAKIKNKIIVDDTIQVRLLGLRRVAINKYYNKENEVLYSNYMYIDLPSLIPEEENAYINKVTTVLKSYVDASVGISNDILGVIKKNKELDKITDTITAFLPFDISKKLEYMQEINPIKRAKALICDMNLELKAIEIDNELDEKVNDTLELDQRNYLLKEKLKVIKEELSEFSWKDEEVRKFRDILNKLKLNKETKEHFEHEITKYEITGETSPDASVIHNYLDWVLNLPWNKSTKEETDAEKVYETLDSTHYGLTEVKSRISEYVAIKNINKNVKSPIICLVGPPGVGKTSIAMAIAKSLNRKFYKISVGGLNDSTELVGTRRTYLASSPGKFIQGINKVKSNNPVILIDEVDKMVRDYKGDPASTLLEILDPVQNASFVDNYIEEPFDLSHSVFILTANYKEAIPLTLLDRVEVIELNSYTVFEKVDIAKNYLLPKILKENAILEKLDQFKNNILEEIINNYTEESGVRDLERVLESLARKISINRLENITVKDIAKILGRPKYVNDLAKETMPGVVNSLAVSNGSGMVTKTEVSILPGSGKLTCTGQIGDVMMESVLVVESMLKKYYNYQFKNIDLHIHFLDASSKKDGPSAGLSIAVAIASEIEKKNVPSDIAFTGEVSLNGSILKVGKVKEKIIGAYNMGINTIYIPKKNSEDLLDVPKKVLNKMKIYQVDNFQDVYTNLFK